MFSPNKKCWLANAGLRVRFATAIIVTRIIIIVNSRTEIGRIKWNQAMPDFLQHQRGKARREPDRNTQPEMPAFAAYGGAMQGENRRKRSVSAAGTALLLGLATASVAADLLPTHAGRLDAGSHRQHTVQTAAGDYVHGRISGNGMLLTLQDEQGRPVRVLAKGRRDQEEFMFVAGSNGPYRLDVKASAAGNYRLDILQRIEREAQTPPADMPESPRLQALLQAGGDTEAFWRDIQRDGAPLIESSGVLPALGQHERLVTFLWRGTGLSRRDTADDGAKHHAGMPSPAAEADQPPAQLAATRSWQPRAAFACSAAPRPTTTRCSHWPAPMSGTAAIAFRKALAWPIDWRQTCRSLMLRPQCADVQSLRQRSATLSTARACPPSH
jgi:hypothetical protein